MLESLANELLLDLFQYFNITQLLRAFRSLNSRFDRLLFIHIRTCRHLDFRSISKQNFNFICQHHLQSIFDQIISLKLSNDDESPQQIELFSSHHFTFTQFTHLQSLSFYQIHSQIIIRNIAADLVQLSNLTHLKFIDCCLSSFYEDSNHSINNIWALSKLIHLQLHDTSNTKANLISSKSISSCLQYISIKNFCIDTNDIYHLLKQKPHLRHVQIYAHLNDDEDITVVELFPSIVAFELYDERFYLSNICFTNDIHGAICLLKATPNLCYLKIETPFIFMDGYRWKCFIISFLPQLKIFRFKMAIYFNVFETVKQRVNYILDSFQSQFWIDEHQWFVRCHWNTEDKYSQCIVFYTLPYTFCHLSITNNHLWSKSTCPYAGNHWSSSDVHHLSYNSRLTEHNIPAKKIEHCVKLNSNQITSPSKTDKLFRFRTRKTKSFSLSNDNPTVIPSSLEKTVQITSYTPLFETASLLYFPNIQQLTVEIPVDEYFWWIAPKLDRLFSLTINLSTQSINQSHIQTLLDRAPCLYSLSFSSDLMLNSNLLLLNNSSKSIRRLIFKRACPFDYCLLFNHEQCIALTCSSLGKQCEVISIGVKHRRSILFLVNTMINLRTLNVRCQDEQYERYKSSSANEELIQWLQHHLPSTVMVTRNTSCNFDIQLWIR